MSFRDPKVFETYRRYLFSIAYRMLGSAMEAEDMVQETYLRYEAASAEEIQNPKAYLSTIITRLCLDQLKSARVQRENYSGEWLPEPILTGDSPSALLLERETISTAFLVLLENLSPLERAVFLLRDVFDYSYTEIASMLGKSEANCRQHYHRAKQYLHAHRPRFEPSSDEQKQLVESFFQAVEAGDVESLTHILAEKAVMYGGGQVPTSLRPITGREAVTRLLLGVYRLAPEEMRAEFAEVNGAPGMLLWQQAKLLAVMTFSIADGQIQAIYNLLNPDKLAHILLSSVKG
jgi:RNA polymerase sigma-70 factor (ECF subfamily)